MELLEISKADSGVIAQRTYLSRLLGTVQVGVEVSFGENTSSFASSWLSNPFLAASRNSSRSICDSYQNCDCAGVLIATPFPYIIYNVLLEHGSQQAQTRFSTTYLNSLLMNDCKSGSSSRSFVPTASSTLLIY
jgi:hypothetical protein